MTGHAGAGAPAMAVQAWPGAMHASSPLPPAPCCPPPPQWCSLWRCPCGAPCSGSGQACLKGWQQTARWPARGTAPGQWECPRCPAPSRVQQHVRPCCSCCCAGACRRDPCPSALTPNQRQQVMHCAYAHRMCHRTCSQQGTDKCTCCTHSTHTAPGLPWPPTWSCCTTPATSAL